MGKALSTCDLVLKKTHLFKVIFFFKIGSSCRRIPENGLSWGTRPSCGSHMYYRGSMVKPQMSHYLRMVKSQFEDFPCVLCLASNVHFLVSLIHFIDISKLSKFVKVFC